MNTERDKLYSALRADIEAFQFDERVTRVFADMIRRSVPGYASVIAMTGVLGAEYVRSGSRVYDLGCSLGTSLISVYERIDTPCTLIGVDSSDAMIRTCRLNLSTLDQKRNISTRLRCEDILETDISNASLVIMNYTLQFIEPDRRLAMLRKIYAGMNPGGILILSEKLGFEDPGIETTMSRLYYDFKKHNGYSDLEISQKRQALEKVLIPETEQVHLGRLANAGFEKTMSWFQCLNFHSFVAFRADA